jgi:hypothetical protein
MNIRDLKDAHSVNFSSIEDLTISREELNLKSLDINLLKSINGRNF